MPANIPLIAFSGIVGSVLLLTVLTVVKLSSLISTFRPTGEYDEDGNWKWNREGREAEQDGQVLFCARFLIFVVCLGLSYVVASTVRLYRTSTTPRTMGALVQATLQPASMGQLIGFLLAFAQMELLSTLYFWNYGREEEEEQEEDRNDRRQLRNYNNYNYNNNNNRNGNNNYNNYNYNQQQEEYEEGYAQYVMSRNSLALFAVYGLVSLALVGLSYFLSTTTIARSQEEETTDNMAASSNNKTDQSTETTSLRRSFMKDVFQVLSNLSIVLLSLTTLVAFVAPLALVMGQEEGGDRDRMREEGNHYNLMLISTLLLVTVIGMRLVSGRILANNTSSNASSSALKLGAFQGVTAMFPLVAILVTALYSGFSFQIITSLFGNAEGDDRRRGGRGMEEAPLGALFFAACCFSLAVLFLFWVCMTTLYPTTSGVKADGFQEEDGREMTDYKNMNNNNYENPILVEGSARKSADP